jgi:signal transduction histidine kinase
MISSKGTAKDRYYPAHVGGIIAQARILLATFLLIPAFHHCFGPAEYSITVFYLLAAYFCYSILLAIIVHKLLAVLDNWFPIRYCIDLAVFIVLLRSSQIHTGTIYLFSVFLMFNASQSWLATGALVSSFILSAFVSANALFPAGMQPVGQLDVMQIITISGGILAMGLLIGFINSHAENRSRDFAWLAQWPIVSSEDIKSAGAKILEHLSRILSVRQMLLIWEEHDEPWLHVLSWSKDECHYSREVPDVFGEMTCLQLKSAFFFARNLSRPRVRIIYSFPSSEGKLQIMKGAPVSRNILERYPMQSVLSLVFYGKMASGRLYAIDYKRTLYNRFEVLKIIANEVANSLDKSYLLRDLRLLAKMEEQNAMARDLHDVILQNLAGDMLRLGRVDKSSLADGQTVQRYLNEYRKAITDTMREIRSYINRLRPFPLKIPAGLERNLVDYLDELNRKLMHQWGIAVVLEANLPQEKLPTPLAEELYSIVHEAVVNAARHAKASLVKIAISAGDGCVNIIISNDGNGFSFHGRYGHEKLKVMNWGPRTLMERTEALGGRLVVESEDTGSRLEFVLPLSGK